MSQPGFTVDHHEIVTAVNKLAEVHGHAAGIIALAEDANPEWYIWGLLGAPFVPWYWSVAGDVYKHLTMMGESLLEKVYSLQTTAENYQGAEEALKNSLHGIEGMLG